MKKTEKKSKSLIECAPRLLKWGLFVAVALLLSLYLISSYSRVSGIVVKGTHYLDEEYIEEGQIDENVYYQWTINSDTFDRTVNEHFTFYTPEGMIQEQHTQNVFEPSVVKEKLESVGLESEVVMDFIEDEKILFIGTK